MGILGTVRMLWETFFQEADFAVFLNETVWISLLFVFCHWVIRRWKGSRWILFCLPAVLVLMGRGVFALTRNRRDSRAEQWIRNIVSIHPYHFLESFLSGRLSSRYVLRWDTSDYLAFGIVLAIFALLLYLAAVVKGEPDGRGVPAGFAVGGGAGSGRDPVAFGDEPGSFLLYRDFCRKQSLPFEGAWSDGGSRIGSAGVSCVLVLPGSGQMEERKLETRQWVRETFTFTDFPAQSVITLPNFPGLSENPGELTNEDNIRYTGNQVAEVVTWNQPEETVYLRNYYGIVRIRDMAGMRGRRRKRTHSCCGVSGGNTRGNYSAGNGD